MAASGGTRAILAAFFANAGIAISKFVAFAFTGASSMLAEAIHSVADAGNQGLLLLGGRRAARDATELHPFGYGRVRYFWSFIVALVLFSLGGLFALFEGYEKLRHPEPIESAGWAFAVLGVAITLELWSFRTAMMESNRIRDGKSWWAFIRHSKVPELPVVLLEDLGALIGLFFALFGVTMAVTTGDPVWDAVGTLAIGLLLVAIAVVLAVEMKSLLVGESASPEEIGIIASTIERHDNVTKLIHFRTQHIGPEEILVTGKLEFSAGLPFKEVAVAIDEIETAIRANIDSTAIIYLEPAVFEAERG